MGKGSIPGLSLTNLSRLYLWIALFLMAAGLFAQQMQIRIFSDSAINDYYTTPVAEQLTTTLSSSLQQTQLLQQNIARSPMTLASLTDPESSWNAQLKSLIPGAVRAEIIPAYAAETLHEKYNYSVQDLVNKSLKGDDRGIEATMIDNRLRYFCVSYIPEGKSVAGILLVEYGSDWEETLWQPLKDSDDQISVYQSVSGPQSKGLSLWTVNQGKGGSGGTTIAINDFWYLTLSPAIHLSSMSMLYSATPWLITMMLTFIALFALHGFIHKRIRGDQQKLYHYLTYDFSGNASRVPEFRLRLFNELAELIRGLVTPVKRTPGDEHAAENLGDDFFASLDVPPKPETEEVAAMTTAAAVSAPASLHGELSVTEEYPVPEHIFRAYDIRGLVASELTPELMTQLGRALGSELKARNLNRTHIAWDGRHSSPELAEAMQDGLTQCGISVNRLGQVPVGVLYFATHQSDCANGIMITGSHNPAEYNGVKVVIDKLPLTADEIQELKQRIQQQDYVEESNAMVTDTDLLPKYLERITSDLTLNRPMTIVLDAGNGVTGPTAETLFRALGAEVVGLYCDIDGDFPNHHPDPGVASNLKDLRQAVVKYGADMGLAFDGDGDRVAVVDNMGRIVSPDHILMLLIEDILPRNPGRDAVYDVKSSRYLASFISRVGGRPTMWKTGHSLMKQKMHALKAVVGGEFSGHFYIGDRWFGFDDGLYNGARLLEILSARHNSTVADVFSQFPADVSTDEITLNTGEERKFPLIDALRKDETLVADARISEIDGLRIEFDDGWGLVRASNTTPKLTLRFAGTTQQSVQRIQTAFREALQREAPDLEVTF